MPCIRKPFFKIIIIIKLFILFTAALWSCTFLKQTGYPDFLNSLCSVEDDLTGEGQFLIKGNKTLMIYVYKFFKLQLSPVGTLTSQIAYISKRIFFPGSICSAKLKVSVKEMHFI